MNQSLTSAVQAARMDRPEAVLLARIARWSWVSSAYCDLTLPRRTPAHIRIHLILPETRVIGLHFCRWVYLHSSLCSGLQKTHVFCNRVRFGHPRSSKVDDFGTNRKRACNFLQQATGIRRWVAGHQRRVGTPTRGVSRRPLLITRGIGFWLTCQYTGAADFFGQYRIILLYFRCMCAWTTCPQLLPDSVLLVVLKVEPPTSWLQFDLWTRGRQYRVVTVNKINRRVLSL